MIVALILTEKILHATDRRPLKKVTTDQNAEKNN